MARVIQRIPDVWVSISATTRQPRTGEVDGREYYFLTDNQFDELIAEDGFLEWAHVHAHRYGTPRKTVEEQIQQGKQVILEIDVQGAFQVKDKMPQAHLVFIEPPSMEELYRRLKSRGTEEEDVIDARMQVAKLELEEKIKYDYTLVNDDLEQATDLLVAYIESLAIKADKE